MRTSFLTPWIIINASVASKMFRADNTIGGVLLILEIVYVGAFAIYMETQIWKYRDLYIDSLKKRLDNTIEVAEEFPIPRI